LSYFVSYNEKVKIPMNTFRATHIGSLAAEILRKNGDFYVKGNTSKGLFLENPEGDLLFLSYETSKGPYSVNIPAKCQEFLTCIEPGASSIQWTDAYLIFDILDMRIAINTQHKWTPEPYSKCSEKPADTSKVVCWAIEYTEPASLLHQTARIIQNVGSMKTINGQQSEGRLRKMKESLRSMNKASFLEAAVYFVGRGSGLTPSGDDILTGISLALYRYHDAWRTPEDYYGWMVEVLQLMKERTTRLSQALFSASMKGLADERLISSLDALMNNKSIKEIVQPVSTWGSSSGFDSLAGALLLIECLDSKRNHKFNPQIGYLHQDSQ